MNNGYTKSVADVISDLKTELQEFVSTRITMLRSEIQENIRNLKMAVPVLVIGMVLLWTTWLLFTGFLVAIIGRAFGTNPWAYVVSLLVVAVGYGILGGAAVMMGLKQIKSKGLKPERTIRVLQQDRIWIQEEARTQL